MKRATLVLIILALSAPVLAQTMVKTPTGVTTTRVDFGLQPVDLDIRSSKFEEYRDVPDGAVLPFFRLFGDEAIRYDVIAENVQQDDSRYRINLGLPAFRLSLDYNQVPHRFGNDGRTLLDEVARGVFAISDSVQQHCQTEVATQWAKSKPSVNFAFLNTLIQPHLAQDAQVIDLGLIRERASMEMRLPPGSLYDVRVTYFQENRDGNRPGAFSFGFGNAMQGPEPVEFKTREIGTSAEMPFSRGLVRGSLRYNDFENVVNSVLFDNPFRMADSTDASAYSSPGSGSIGGAATGRLDLPADNRSITGSLGGIMQLPARSRLSADLSFSRWTQDTPFIAYTTNTAITSPLNAADINSLPAQSLDGEMNIVSGVLAFTSRPLPRVSVSARYRTYDLNNDTRRIEFPGYVRFDAVWEEIPRISVPYGYKTQRSDFAVAYDLGRFNLEGGYRWEQWDREFRETRQTTEGVWRLGADVRLFDWASLRTSYELGSRDFDEYDPVRGAEPSFVHPEDFNNIPTLRRYDQAERDLDRISALLQLTPFETMSFSVSYLMTDYDYNKSEHGLLRSKNDSLTAEVDYAPTERLNVYGFFTRELFTSFQRDRQSGATPSTDPRNDWTADLEDKGDSYGAGASFALIPEKLDFRILGQYQRVDGTNDLFTPEGGTPALAYDILEVDDTKIWSGNAEFLYQLNPTWGLAVGGWIEDYQIRDAATTGVTNFMPSSFFLAPNDSDYRGNVFYIKTSFRR